MTGQQWDLLIRILDAVGKLPDPKQHQLLGVAQGMEMGATAETGETGTQKGARLQKRQEGV